MHENDISEGHEAEEYVGLVDFVAEGDEQVCCCAHDGRLSK